MAFWDTWRAGKKAVAEQQRHDSLYREFEDTAEQMEREKRAFAERGTFTGVDLDEYHRKIAMFQNKLIELRSRGVAEGRAVTGFPWLDNNPAIPFGAGGPAHPSQVHTGMDHVLRLAPVYAAARLLADGVASLPLQVYRPAGEGIPERWNGPSIFNRNPEAGGEGQGPSVIGTLYDWLFQCMTSLVLEGNAFGYITSRDGFGYPQSIEWFDPNKIYIEEWDANGMPNPLRAQYFYEGRQLRREELFHIRAFTVPGRVRGVSPMKAFASLVNQGLGTQQYGADWFANGGFPPGIMRNMLQEVNDEQSTEIKSRLVAAIRRHQPLVIGADWDYKPVSVPPSEAQFIEATQMNATQIAAVYGIPAYRIGGSRNDSLSYSNVEAETISFLTDTLRPWLVRLESAFYGLLPGNRYCRFNADAMIRTDTKTRHEIFQIDRTIGLRPTDELRQIEDLPPLKNGEGKDQIPLLVASDLSRSGKAVPKVWADDVTVLEVPPGATPGITATHATETPQTDEISQTGKPDQPGKSNPAGGSGSANPKTGQSANGSGASNGSPAPKKSQPAKAPAANGGSRDFSVTDVAQAWAGANASDPLKFRAYLAETGTEAKRHGIEFTGYMDACMTGEQRGWLLGFMRARGEPEAQVVTSPNGNSAHHV